MSLLRYVGNKQSLLWQQTSDKRCHNSPLSPNLCLLCGHSTEASHIISSTNHCFNLLHHHLTELIKHLLRADFYLVLRRCLQSLLFPVKNALYGIHCICYRFVLSSTGGGLAGLCRHGSLFSVFLLDHNEDQPEDQRERQLQIHRHPRYLWLWELWGEVICEVPRGLLENIDEQTAEWRPARSGRRFWRSLMQG